MKKADDDYKPIIAVLNGSSVESAFRRLGAESFMVRDEKDEKAAIRFADGIAFTGGGDIDPTRYDADKWHPDVYGVDHSRDERELKMVVAARKRGIPMFGVCRGLQILNVGHGGTLHQHIEDFSNTITHWGGARHGVHLRAGSMIQQALNKGTVFGTSIHHQSVDRIGDGLLPSGWSNDGIVEMIESVPDTWPYVLATQFHPEMDYAKDDDAKRIFAHFLKVCTEKAQRRKPTITRMAEARKMRYPQQSHSPYVYVQPSYGAERMECPHGFRYMCTVTEDAKPGDMRCVFDQAKGYVGQRNMPLPVTAWKDPKPRCKHGFTYHKSKEYTSQRGVHIEACDFDGDKVEAKIETYTEYESNVLALRRKGSEDDPRCRAEEDWQNFMGRWQGLLQEIQNGEL